MQAAQAMQVSSLVLVGSAGLMDLVGQMAAQAPQLVQLLSPVGRKLPEPGFFQTVLFHRPLAGKLT